MSSSMRNAIQRRNHRERAQPLERQKLGLLEKHKDYSLRAADHKKKQRTLKNLRAKAADRNEDEFYFGMMSRKGAVRGNFSSKGRKWDGIVDGDRGSLKGMELDVSRLLKTQDLGYLRTMRNVAQKDVKVLEERVIALGGTLEGMGGGVKRSAGEMEGDSEDEFAGLDDDDDDDDMDEERPKRKKKFVFSEGVEEREDMLMEVDGEMMDDDVSRDEDENEEQSIQRQQQQQQQQQQKAKSSKAKTATVAPQKTEKERREEKQLLLEKLERRLAAARRKVTVLSRAEQKLELQRAKMAKTATATGSVTKAGKKIKVRERKR